MNLAQLDLQRFLTPINGEDPAGCDIEYEPIFEKISQARESDDLFLGGDEWSTQAREADWATVSLLCQQVLEKQSKDLQIACWLVQAQGELYGLEGMNAGLRLLTQLIIQFWPTMWPKLDETDEESVDIRLSRLDWLDKQLIKQIDELLLTKDGKLSLNVWHRVQYFEQQVASNAAVRSALMDDGYFGVTECDGSIRATPAEYLQQLFVQSEQLHEALQGLQQAINACASNVGIVMRESSLHQQELKELLGRFYETVAPGMSYDMQQGGEGMQNGSGPGGMFGALKEDLSHHEIRAQAINQLAMIAGYFRRNEPTSPVPYLLERAVRWADMGMAEWLEEMMEDNSSALREIMRIMRGPKSDED